jgi:hypothetical protein
MATNFSLINLVILLIVLAGVVTLVVWGIRNWVRVVRRHRRADGVAPDRR